MGPAVTSGTCLMLLASSGLCPYWCDIIHRAVKPWNHLLILPCTPCCGLLYQCAIASDRRADPCQAALSYLHGTGSLEQKARDGMAYGPSHRTSQKHTHH